MDPLGAVEGQVYALQGSLHLLLGLLIPCLLLLCLLNCLLLLRGWGPGWPQGRAKACGQGGPLSPHLFQVLSGSASGWHSGNGRLVTQQQPPPPGQPAPASPRHVGCHGATPVQSGGAGLPRLQPGFSDRRQPRGRPSHRPAQGRVSSSSDLEKHPILAPPNSPAVLSGAADIPGKGSHATSTQKKLWSRKATFPTHSHSVPFEYGSSIQWEEKQAPLSSANFTASQGPGLDSDFGASAGISVRILSSDSEGSPKAPLLCRQQSGQFEWDYYDPSYRRRAQPHRQLPPLCSKQYWL